MACCLTASSSSLHQCWLKLSNVHWQSPDDNFTWDISSISHCKTSGISRTKSQNLNGSCIPLQLSSLHWSQVLIWEWRCSWSSADRRCSNYIWVTNNLIAYTDATYIRGFTVLVFASLSHLYISKIVIISFMKIHLKMSSLTAIPSQVLVKMHCNWLASSDSTP